MDISKTFGEGEVTEMHKIGEDVLYGGGGVMKIVDIREESVGDTARRYYVLSSVGASSGSLTFVPTDNKKLIEQMRPLLTKEEIFAIIHTIDALPTIEWVLDNRVRSERFKTILDSGDRSAVISMMHTIREMGKLRLAEGKKNYLSDENMLKKAEKLIYSEFSIVLGIPEGEIPDFIEKEKNNA
jgi:CarD family transcriptional regulator